MPKPLSELTSKKLVPYISKAADQAGDHDYMAGVMGADGVTSLEKKHSEKAKKRRAGIKKAAEKIAGEGKMQEGVGSFLSGFTRIKPHKKIEPTLGEPSSSSRSAPEVKGGQKPEKEASGKEYPVGQAEHTFHINADLSIDHTPPDGKRWNFQPSFKNKNDAHKAVLKGVRTLTDMGEKVKVVDSHITGYRQTIGRMPKTYVPAHIIKEEEIMNEDTAAPKPLRAIAPKPSRRYNEYEGNTQDERDIVARIKKNTVMIPDRNGNSDDVFKGADLKHNGKHVLPGDDEKKYAEWNGKVPKIDEEQQLDEISAAAMRSYRDAARSFKHHQVVKSQNPDRYGSPDWAGAARRDKGIERLDRLSDKKGVDTHNYTVHHDVHPELGLVSTRTYRDGVEHSVNDEPSYVDHTSGVKYWHQDGRLHRDGDKPAVTGPHRREWHQNGKLHRDGDKPAVITRTGEKAWYQRGHVHRDGDKPAHIGSDGTQSWFSHGDMHRDGGKPSRVHPDGSMDFHVHGVLKKTVRAVKYD